MWKILCKNILALYRYRHFCVGIFYFASPYTVSTVTACEIKQLDHTNSCYIHCVSKNVGLLATYTRAPTEILARGEKSSSSISSPSLPLSPFSENGEMGRDGEEMEEVDFSPFCKSSCGHPWSLCNYALYKSTFTLHYTHQVLQQTVLTK